MRGPSPLYIEERHRALGRDATFSWSRALTRPPRCNRTRHRGRHLDFVGAAILVSWGPPSWTGSRGGRHLGPEVTSKTLKWRLYYSPTGKTCTNPSVPDCTRKHISSILWPRATPWTTLKIFILAKLYNAHTINALLVFAYINAVLLKFSVNKFSVMLGLFPVFLC